MKPTVLSIVLAACLVGAGVGFGANQLPPQPDPKPFAAVSLLSRQDPTLKVSSFPWSRDKESKIYEQPSFIVGNKSVCVRRIEGRDLPTRDSSVTVYIDNKQVGCFMWWGAFKSDVPDNFGFPFKDIKDDPSKLLIDEKNKTVTYQKPYLTPDQKRAIFSYTLRALKDSKVELSWDLGVSQEELDSSPTPFGVSLWFTMGDCYRAHKLTHGGKAFSPASAEELADNKIVRTKAAGEFVFAAGDPAQSYSVEFGELSGEIQESCKNSRFNYIYRSGQKKPQVSGKIIIDLGEAGIQEKEAPLPVGGIDFWKIDGTHVPISPVRNIMPNPSFEQGMRYWRWIGGGAHYDPASDLRYDIVPQGLFGKNALIMRDTQPRSPGLRSFPLPVENGQTYTLSFYAKSDKACNLSVALMSAARGGKFASKNGPFGDSGTPDATFKIGPEWKRYSRTFTADGAGLHILLSGANNTLLDGLQLEKGDKPTDFVAPPIDGVLTTSDPDNDLVKGAPIDAGFSFTGQPGTAGEVVVSVINAFKETVGSEILKVDIPEGGVQKVNLPLDPKKVGEGVFVVKAEYKVKGVAPYVDYFRFAVMAPLFNMHETKDVFGLGMHILRVGRGEDLARKLMQWGFGSTSWGVNHDPGDYELHVALDKKYRFTNYVSQAVPSNDPDFRDCKSWTEVTPVMEKKIEEAAYEKVKLYDPELYNTWSFGNEEESSYLPGHKMFDEYFKAQSAAARGAKRANPNAKFTPTSGTSGYNRLRGYDAIEGYLKASNDHKFKYDAVSVHPYGNIDKGTLGGNDLDEETARLVDQMRRYGYGKETPIYYTEMFNVPDAYIPSWGADSSYDDCQGGKPTYDFGNREFIHASSLARIWIIVLKYWPQVRSTNVWVYEPFLDYRLTPLLLCKAANTLGHLLPDVEYQADIKPAAGVRGYAFKLKDGSGIAPIWCVDHDVENGLRRGPVVQVKFGQDVEVYDLMGNRRSSKADADGVTAIQLTPAPLFIKAKNVALLAKALQIAESNDSQSALQVSVRPAIGGNVEAVIKNLTGRRQSGVLDIAGKSTKYAIEPEASKVIDVSTVKPNAEFGKMFHCTYDYKVQPSKGAGMEKEWKMDYFYVPKTSGMPDWAKIPAIPITNRHVSEGYKGTFTPADLSANFKMAWDKENLYLHVEAEDDKFLVLPELWKLGNADKALYVHDGCLEVYFDTGANGRTNHEKTYDLDDYRYDFSIGKSGKSGPGMVFRLREVNPQLADGMNMPTKEEAAQKIKCDFQITDKGYAYTITFAQRYLEPLMLRQGFLSGFALYLHDTDDASQIGCPKGLSLAAEPGSHCDGKPYLWPLMMLSDKEIK